MYILLLLLLLVLALLYIMFLQGKLTKAQPSKHSVKKPAANTADYEDEDLESDEHPDIPVPPAYNTMIEPGISDTNEDVENEYEEIIPEQDKK